MEAKLLHIDRVRQAIDLSLAEGLPLAALTLAAVNQAAGGAERIGQERRYRARHRGAGVFIVCEGRVA